MSEREAQPKKAESTHSKSPLVKYEENNKFPLKMISHFLLVVFTTMQIVIIFSYSNSYSRAQERFLYNTFISSDDKREVDYQKKAYLYTAKDVKEHVIASISSYYTIDDSSLDQLSIPDSLKVYLDSSYLRISPSHSHFVNRVSRYAITKDYFGPFSGTDLDIKRYLSEIVSFRLNYTFHSHIPNEYTNEYECIQWNMLQTYSFELRAHFVVRLNIGKSLCEVRDSEGSVLDSFWSKMLWIHSCVMLLGVYSLFTTWKYIKKVASLFIRIRTKYKIIIPHEPASDNSVYYNPLNDTDKTEYDETQANKGITRKRKIKFNKWSLICLIGSVIQIFGSLLAIFDINHLMSSTEILIGFGCFFAYLSIGRYIEYAKDYSTIYITIQKSLPNVMRYVLGATPVFLGFLFFGLCVFWKSERFGSIADVTITLFSLAIGDSIYVIFQDLKGIYFFLGQLYLYLFCILFITVVLNIFIAIVQEAYFATANQEKTHWIYNKNDTSQRKDASVYFPAVKLRKEGEEKQAYSSFQKTLKSKQAGTPRNASHTPTLHKKKFHSGNGSHENYPLAKTESVNKRSMLTHGDRESDAEIQGEIRKEFDNVLEKIRQISEISKGIFKTQSQKVYEEVRENIFDSINDNVNIKLQEIKDLFTSGDTK